MTPPLSVELGRRRPRLFVMSGPSGVGKDTVLGRLLPISPDVRRVVTATSRLPRAGEAEGVDHYFLSRAAFESLIAEGGLLEHAEVFGRDYYGTPRGPVSALLADGLSPLLQIDVQGAKQVKAAAPDAVLIFLLPPSVGELERRLRGRGSDTAQAVQARLSTAADELREAPHYDYAVINDDLDRAVAECRAIIVAEQLRLPRLA
jgi:guanylate kinase